LLKYPILELGITFTISGKPENMVFSANFTEAKYVQNHRNLNLKTPS